MLLFALVLTGCGRRAVETDAGAPLGEPIVALPASTVLGPSATPGPVDPEPSAEADSATKAPGTTPEPTPAPTAAAMPPATPDLTAVEQWLDDLDAALGADATADLDEGSSN